MDPWELLGERPGPAGWIRVVTRTYRFPDGRVVDWDVHAAPDTVGVVALTEAGTVVLARQFRPGPGVVLDELPGGFVDPGESPAEAARRELREETGFDGEVEILGSCWVHGSITTRRFAALARSCRHVGEPTPEASEVIEVVEKPLAEFVEQVRAGAMTDTDLAMLVFDHLGGLPRP